MLLPLLLTLGALPGDSTAVHRGDLGQLNVTAPFVESVEVRLDGSLDEPVWQNATVMTGFTRYEPTEGVPASQRTEVRVFYAPDAIYFGIHAFDDDPERIQVTLAERDTPAYSDDWVRIVLDTFNDNRQAYIFYVNPLGVQQDGLWIEGAEKKAGGQPIDFNPDFIWDSNGRLTDDGWVVEVRVPYVSLRFREAEEQTWGINFARETKRTGFKEAWAPITSNRSSTLEQSGRLTGLRGLRPRRLVELNPIATGKVTGARTDAGAFQREGFEPDVGLNARLGITSNLVLDATVNPDFSQLEADEGQIAVNERFGLFVPEKRPFFLEGTEIFQTPQRLVHTRQVVEPIGGAKVTGKLGSFNVAYLGALDQSPLGAGEGDNALVNLMRLRRDIGAGSTVGMLLTDRSLTESGGYNRVVGLDSRFLFAERYTLTTQLAGSWTREAGAADALPTSPMLFLQLERAGRNLSWEARLNDVSPGFRAENGFITRLGDAQLFASAKYTFYGKPGALVERWGPEIRVDNFFDHDELWRGGRPEEGEVELLWNTLLRGKNRLNALVRYGYFDFQPEDYAHYETETAPGTRRAFELPDPLRNMLALALMPHLQLRQWMSLGGRAFFREVPIYNEANRGFEVLVAPELRVWATPHFNFQVGQTHSRIFRSRQDELYSVANISRFKAKYQFSKALSLRGLVQYNLQSREPLLDPASGAPLWVNGRLDTGRAAGDFGVQLLGSYEPSPGRVIYLGYSRQMVGPDTYRYDRMEPQVDGLFLKMSYLVRM
jgi:hypothetical protein